MHVWFRQYAQQMGMQNVRAILPEQIDLLINTSITDTINEIIKTNIGVTNDRVITDNSKIGQINALSTLYKVLEVNAKPYDKASGEVQSRLQPFTKQSETFIFRQSANIAGLKGEGTFEYLFLTDLAINYTDKSNSIVTNYFPVRIIDDAFLADVLNDFILRPRVRTPIAVVYNNKIDLYIDNYTNKIELPQGLQPNTLRVSYVAKPAKVRYAEDLGGENVDCDMPEYLHVDILKHAVDLWRISVSGSLHASQQQEQVQQQENARNNYRNEGNQ